MFPFLFGQSGIWLKRKENLGECITDWGIECEVNVWEREGRLWKRERGKGQREKLRKMKKRENKIVYENKIERVYERERVNNKMSRERVKGNMSKKERYLVKEH